MIDKRDTYKCVCYFDIFFNSISYIPKWLFIQNKINIYLKAFFQHGNVRE